MKKILVLVLSLALVMGSFGFVPVAADEEPITLSLSVIWDHETAFDQTIFDELAAELGVTFDIRLIEKDVASDKMNTMFMSNDYPEVLTHPGFNNTDLITYGTDEGILIPLEDLIAEYAPTITATLEANPAWRQMMTMPDGHIYGLPTVDSGGGGHGDISYKMWIYTPWLDAVEMDMPTTLDQFCDVLRAFKTKDPNGNNEADEIGLTGATGTWAADPWLYLMNSFGVFNENYYYVKDGQVQRIADADYVREGLSYLNAMYEEGLIDPGAFTQDLTALGTVGNAETLISGMVSAGHIGMYLDVNNYDRFNGWTNLNPMEGPNGYCAIPYNLSASVSGSDFSITDVCEHPEIAIKLADLISSEEWCVRHQVGIQGIDWDYADEGTVGMDGSPAKYKYLAYTVSASNGANNKWGHTCRILEPAWKQMFQVTGDIYDAANYEAYLYQNTIKLKEYAADVDVIPPLVYADNDAATDAANYSTNVTNFVKASIAEFITGVKDIDDDAAWEKYKADLEGYQYSEWIDLLQETINSMGYGVE